MSLCGFQWQLGSEEGLIMRRIACARCGRRLPVKFGVMPRRCACGEEFEWAPLGGFGRSTAVLAAFALLMSPILVLIWFTRRLLQDSIVLYAVALIVVFYWFRVCETLLVRFGLVRMALAISPAFHAPCGVLRRPGEYPLPVFVRLIWREAFVCRSPVGCER